MSLSMRERLVAQGMKPFAMVQGKELVSYPWCENGKVYVNARTVPGDPRTMRLFEIVDGKLVAA